MLVVEDDPSLRGLYVDLLRDDGWAVHGAADGLEALEALDAGLRPCVTLVDLRMPRMDGWQLARILAERDLRFVLIAAHYQIELEAERVGARWWLQKPVAIDRLLETVSQVCRSSEAA